MTKKQEEEEVDAEIHPPKKRGINKIFVIKGGGVRVRERGRKAQDTSNCRKY